MLQKSVSTGYIRGMIRALARRLSAAGHTRVMAAVALLGISASAAAETYTLEQCRSLALQNNKELMVRRQNQQTSEFQKKQAFAAYLPAFDFTGGYVYNQKNISLLNSADMLSPVDPAMLGSLLQKYPQLGELLQNPMYAQMAGDAIGKANEIVDDANSLLKKSTTYDIHNVFFGAVTLTQPIFMGGRIVALNKLAELGKEAAEKLYHNEAQNVIYAVDGAYWTVVALKAKYKLAKSYVALLDTLHHDVNLLFEQGVATRSDVLSVDVKLNQANVDLTKVENGLSLSRMALAQVCGLPVNSEMEVQDEDNVRINAGEQIASHYDMDAVYEARPDLAALGIAQKAAEQKAKIERAAMLPQLALIGAYSFSNPNAFDGFRKRFDGAFSVGVMLKIPLWHWGGNYYAYKAAKSSAVVTSLQLDNARELVNLQVSQAAYKAQEALKTYKMTCANLEKANENLRTATVGFHEGVITSTDVMAAQTAWLKANSEKIDAVIDVQLCDVYLSKVLGRLNY